MELYLLGMVTAILLMGFGVFMWYVVNYILDSLHDRKQHKRRELSFSKDFWK